MAYLWRAVDAEGEVLDVMVTDDLGSYAAAARDLGMARRHERSMEEQPRRELASANPPAGAENATLQKPWISPEVPMPPSTTSSTSNASSHRPERTERSAPPR
jgi:transposase-like protein